MIIEKLMKQADFTDVEKSIAAYLMKNGFDVKNMSIQSLARATFSSPSTITRFCRKLGLDGYKKFQILFYSENCFGTADTIVFRNGTLRIHDLKTGVVPAHMEQLEIYAALFCLEYKVKPGDIEMELRIYQNNEILYHNPTAEDIVPIMDKIITFDKVIRKIKEQEG